MIKKNRRVFCTGGVHTNNYISSYVHMSYLVGSQHCILCSIFHFEFIKYSKIIQI